MDLGGMYTSKDFYFTKISLNLCKNSTTAVDSNGDQLIYYDESQFTTACATPEEIEKYRTSDSSTFSIYFPNKLINSDDPK